jgi:hypothetical protein
MRNLFLVLLLLCASIQAWQLRSLRSPAAAEDGMAPVAAAPPGPLERLGRLVGKDVAPAAVPATMVHCVIGGVGRFVRSRECLELGGAIDEPSWARTEG